MNRNLAAGVVGMLLWLGSTAGAQPSQGDPLRREMDVARRKVYPALVNITVVARFFQGGRAQRSPAGGSGVIISPRGHVLTNFHVAGHTTRIVCTLPSGEAMEATVVAHDPLTDLSVLKLRTDKRADPGAPLPCAHLGDSDALQVGDHVLAMGNPLMLSSSMTLGIVSNTKRVFTDFTGTEIEDRDLESGEKTGMFTRWIQHDALILPGNSGGPLVNMRGEVVGINELGGNGVGFAIPSNIAARVLKHALAYGEVRRGWLGFSVLPVDKLGRKTGALVSAVVPGSSVEKAGLRAGDILLTLNGSPVAVRFFEQVPLLYQRVATMPAGTQVGFRVLHDGVPRTIMATVSPMEKFIGDEEEIRTLGVTVEEITGPMALARRYPDRSGVVITGVRSGYPLEAAQPKLTDGDVILSMAGRPVTGIRALRRALAANKSKELPITYRRGSEVLISVVTIPEEKSTEEGGELPKAWLGVRTQVVTPEIARALQTPDAKGFRITQVYPWTEASKAGLRTGDIITAVNGTTLDASRPQDAEDLKRVVEDLNVGDNVAFSLVRAGRPLKLTILLEPPPALQDKAKRTQQKEFEFAGRDITPIDRMENHWPKDQAGVLVLDVTSGGWAQMAGLRVDDVILSLDGRPVRNVDGFERAMRAALQSRRKVVQIFVLRGSQTHFVFIEPDWTKLTAEK